MIVTDKTLFLVFNTSLLAVWKSDETIFQVSNISLLTVWTSDKTGNLCRVWYITSYCLDIRWNTPSRFRYTTSGCLDMRWTPLFVLNISLLTVWISDRTLRLLFDKSLLSVMKKGMFIIEGSRVGKERDLILFFWAFAFTRCLWQEGDLRPRFDHRW